MSDSEVFDPMTPQNLQDPFPLLARLRSEKPVYRSDKYSLWLARLPDVTLAAREFEYHPIYFMRAMKAFTDSTQE